jgi:hypothetical protein
MQLNPQDMRIIAAGLHATFFCRRTDLLEECSCVHADIGANRPPDTRRHKEGHHLWERPQSSGYGQEPGGADCDPR